MNEQAYNLWYEHFSGMIRLNLLWDGYDRMFMDAFRRKPILKVVEFGYTPKESNWREDACFTQQMSWLAENGFGFGLGVVKSADHITRSRRNYPDLQFTYPADDSVIAPDVDIVMFTDGPASTTNLKNMASGSLVGFLAGRLWQEDVEALEADFKRIYFSVNMQVWKKK